MKQISHTVILLMTFLLVININAQNKVGKVNILHHKQEKLSINQLKGNVVVIYIYNPEDSNEKELIKKLGNKYKNEGIVFLSITRKGYQNKITFFSNNLVYQRNINTAEGETIFDHYQTSMFNVFPIYIIKDQKGKITYKKKGSVRNIERKMKKKINVLLAKNFEESTIPETLYTSN